MTTTLIPSTWKLRLVKKKKAGFTEKGRGLFFHKQCFQTLALCVDFSLLDVGLTGIVRIVIYEVFCLCF